MSFYDFADALCRLDTAIVKYQAVEKARDYCRQGNLPLPPDVNNTILDVLGVKLDQYEKQIVELATKLTNLQEEQPAKKKK